MKKKLKIQFWKAENTLAMQILEQEGLPRYKDEGFTRIWDQPGLYECSIDLRGRAKWANLNIPCIEFDTNTPSVTSICRKQPMPLRTSCSLAKASLRLV